ncbi:hypothetical protein JNW88_26320, partial [Micromonospora sp. ATA32]|nr:hypothetical protein [Micromonospora sp. ATA32]
MGGTFLLVSQYLQLVEGHSPLRAGLLLVPRAVAMIGATTLTPLLAWSAAAAVLLLQAGAGLYPDVPAGRVEVRPLAGAELGALSVDRFRIAGAPVGVQVDRTGQASVTGLPANLRLTDPSPTVPH